MDVKLNVDEMLFDFPPSQDPDEGAPDFLYDSDDLSEMLFDNDDDENDMILTPPLTKISSGVQQEQLGADGLDMSTSTSDRAQVIAQIESVIQKVVEGFWNNNHQVSISLQSRANITRKNGVSAGDPTSVPPPKNVVIKFPGNNVQEAWRFTVVIRILELIHSSLIDNTIMTKRDMYYRHPDLFVKQAVVDRYIDDLACTFGVSRSMLNVVATAKGLIAGNFVLRRKDGTCIHGLSEEEGLLVPKLQAEDVLELDAVRWILVIEKEATFRAVLNSHQWRTIGSQSLVLTAKGYPDVASRKFLRSIADEHPHIPMYALVDFDPDGIAILSTYKHGSYRLAHEDVSNKHASGLRLPEVQWLGVQSHHITGGRAEAKLADTRMLPDTQGLMKLTIRDRHKAQRMLEWDLCAEGGLEAEWRGELQRMLMLNMKAEMQILDEVAGGLVSWLVSELEMGLGAGPQHPSATATATGSAFPDDELLF